MNSIRQDRRAFLWAVCLLGIAGAFFALNLLTCLYADDFSYTYTFAVKENKYRISNLYELYLSQRNHYQVMNGRTVVHTLAQLFLMWGKPLFNVLNTLAFLGLGVLIYHHGRGSRTDFRPGAFFAVFFLLWVVTPAFGESFLWLVGACNYLFGILIILLCLLPVTRGFRDGFLPKPAWKTAGFFLLSLLAGWTNENNAVALVVVFLLTILTLLLQKKSVPLWLWAGLVGSIIGCLLLLLSPGEATRLANSGGLGGLGTWIRRGVSITVRLIAYLWPLLLGSAVCLFVGWRRQRPVRELIVPGIWLMAALASTYSMVMAPTFPTRTWSGPVVFFLILLGTLYRWAFPEMPGKRTTAVVTLCALALTAVTYAGAVRDLSQTREQFRQREAYIAAEKAAGRLDVTLSPIYGSTKYNCYNVDGDLNADSTQWPNTAYAMYYELDSVSKGE